jgi:hypothetical protein
MRRIFLFLVLLGSLMMVREVRADAPAPARGKVMKVLPLLLNRQGQDALSPSLFDRDAYQKYLRLHTNEISAVRYDVQWKASGTADARVKIRVELRAIAPDGSPVLMNLEAPAAKTGWWGRWTTLLLAGEDYQKMRHVVAWRATLWAGDQLLGEQKSFLW